MTERGHEIRKIQVVCLLLVTVSMLLPRPSFSADSRFGGYVKVKSFLFAPSHDDILSLVSDATGLDGIFEGRVTGEVFPTPHLSFEAHYRFFASAGETRRREAELAKRFPFLSGILLSGGGRPRHFLDLSKDVRTRDSTYAFHEIDRLSLNLVYPEWSLSAGRQAESWGHGFLFNPFDLLNPFSPTEIDREYKPGEDMVKASVAFPPGGSLKMLFVPRKDPEKGCFSFDESSEGLLLTFPAGGVDVDIFLSRHFDDLIAGAGAVGYLGGAAVRGDVTWTFLDDPTGRGEYLSIVLNVDYSSFFLGRNFYGFLEFFYNGLGGDEYEKVLSRDEVSERLERGELFVLGESYAAGSMRVELHPLFNQFVTIISNVKDPSAIFQLYGVWDAAEDFQVIVGGSFSAGERGTEFGGYSVPGTGAFVKNPPLVFLWLSRYF